MCTNFNYSLWKFTTVVSLKWKKDSLGMYISVKCDVAFIETMQHNNKLPKVKI